MPEQDQLDGFTHPRATRALFGHAEGEQTLLNAFRSGHMHHGWLIMGSDGIGKATLAYRAARYFLAAEGDRTGDGLTVTEGCAADRQITALSHPSLLVIRRNFDTKTKRFPTAITVDEVRRLKGFLARSAEQGSWRVVIVDKADELNLNAANALLKSLEEPPAQTVFFLVSTYPGRLLPTIRSRVRTLQLSALSDEALKSAVAQAFRHSSAEISHGPPTPSEWDVLRPLAMGSVRRVITLHADKGTELYQRVAKLVSDLPSVDWAAVHSLSDELQSPAAEQKFSLFYEILMDYISRIIRDSASGADTDYARTGARLIGPDRLATWAGLWERVAAEKNEALTLNLDRKALILDIFSKLESASAGR